MKREELKKKREELKRKQVELQTKLKELNERRKLRAEEEKAARKERRAKLRSALVSNLLNNRKYLLSLIITLIFFGVIIVNELSQEVDKVKIANDISEDVVEPITKAEKLDDTLDVSNYVGIYTRVVNLNNSIKLNSCTMSSYKLLYKIESNKKISKYLVSDCLGNILIKTSTLSYYNSGGARYIGTEDVNFIFGTNSMKEVDGETYKIDSDITKISEKQVDKSIDTYFLDNDIIITTNEDIYLIKESVVSFQIPSEYINNGGNLNKRVYKAEDGYNFKFIVFSNEENKSCYDNAEESEELLYTIYQVSYNKESKEFDSVKQILTRNKDTSCKTYQEDLDNLKG